MANSKALTRDEVLEYLKQQFVSGENSVIAEDEVTSQMFAKKMGISEETARKFLIKQKLSGKMTVRQANVNGHFAKVYKLKEN